MSRTLSALLLLLSGAALAADSAVPVDAGRSSIIATFTQMNVPVDGRFARFSGDVRYDPQRPDASHAELEIDTASFDLGDEEYNAEVRKPEWFDSQAHPRARFHTTAVRPIDERHFMASGVLSLKGRALALDTRVQMDALDGRQRFSGELPLSRRALGIGDAEWDEVLDDRVLVKFVVVVPRS